MILAFAKTKTRTIDLSAPGLMTCGVIETELTIRTTQMYYPGQEIGPVVGVDDKGVIHEFAKALVTECYVGKVVAVGSGVPANYEGAP